MGSKDVDMEVEVDQVEGKGKGKGKVVDDVLRVCAEFGMDEVLKSVCKVSTFLFFRTFSQLDIDFFFSII